MRHLDRRTRNGTTHGLTDLGLESWKTSTEIRILSYPVYLSDETKTLKT
jgi:hypothetical protein